MKRTRGLIVFALCGICGCLMLISGCRQTKTHQEHAHEQHAHTTAHDDHHHEHGDGHTHTAAHGGCLNAIVTCENGHVEAKVEGDTLHCWFVGGGTDTENAVQVGDQAITLSVMPASGQPAKTLILKATPNALAEETVGNCSTFEGKAAWLSSMPEFVATGTIKQFKGKSMPLRIEYPHGYDPD